MKIIRQALEQVLAFGGKHSTTIIAVATILIITFATLIGALEFMELKAIDAAFGLRGPRPAVVGPKNNTKNTAPETAVVIVAIDDESFDQTKLQWPWPRSYFAKLINKIAQGRPKAITVDVFWYEPSSDPKGDAELAAAIKNAGNVILANDLGFESTQAGELYQYRLPLPEFVAGAKSLGLANLKRDTADGFVRQMPLYLVHRNDGQAYYSWSALSALAYLNASVPTKTGDPLLFGNTAVPNDRGYLNVNYLGEPGKAFNQMPAYQVLNGDLEDSKGGVQYFKDKVVLIGATSISLQDSYPTPFGGANPPMPGVEIHANVIDTILSQEFIFRWPVLWGVGITLLLGIIAYSISFIPRPILGVGLILVVLFGYTMLWLFSFTQLHTEIYLAAPVINLLLSYAVPATYRATNEALEKRRVRNLFAQFLSPEMVGQIIDRGIEASRGQRTELTVLFSDIRGFTTMSEKMTPDEVVDLLNEYLGEMTDVIHQYGGTIDKYEGDLIMAFFNAPLPQPDHAQRAVQACIAMRHRLDELKAKWSKTTNRPTNFEMGIGLNTGDAFVGLIGSSKRINYTCIGDSVNLASRLQDLTKDLKWPLLISEFTYEKIKDEYDAEFAEARLVKGKTKPVGIYKVIGRKGAKEEEKVRALFA